MDEYLFSGKIGSMILSKDDLGNTKVIKSYNRTSEIYFDSKKRRALISIEHKNILSPSKIFHTNNKIYAVYDYIKSENLEDYVKKKGKLTDEEIHIIMKGILVGCDILRSYGLIHGNIKPQNILIEEAEKPIARLVDFLIAKKEAFDNENYTAPEIISKESDPSLMSDIWSIGAVLKFLCANDSLLNKHSYDLIEKSMQPDKLERIIFDEIFIHPYFTSDEVIKKFSLDYLYNCTCSKSDGVILSCGDSYCMGCFAQLKWTSKHYNDEWFRFLFETSNSPDLYNCQYIKILCSKCLCISEIAIIKLRCGCIYRSRTNMHDFLIRKNENGNGISDSIEAEFICKKHGIKIGNIEKYIIYGRTKTDFFNSKSLKDTAILEEALNGNNSLGFINFDERSIGNNGAKVLSKALMLNNSLKSINLACNGIHTVELKEIMKSLSYSASLCSIYLSCNKIGDEGAKAIAEFLENSDSLNLIELCNDRICAEGATEIAKSLSINASLNFLNLRNNNIGIEGAKAIGKSLEVNTSLNFINLHSTNIGNEGVEAISKSLKANISINSLDLSYNNIDYMGTKAIAELLKVNASITTLYLSANDIDDECAKLLAESLIINTSSLKVIVLAECKIGDEGAEVIGEALKINTSLNEFNLSNNTISDPGAKALGKA